MSYEEGPARVRGLSRLLSQPRSWLAGLAWSIVLHGAAWARLVAHTARTWNTSRPRDDGARWTDRPTSAEARGRAGGRSVRRAWGLPAGGRSAAPAVRRPAKAAELSDSYCRIFFAICSPRRSRREARSDRVRREDRPTSGPRPAPVPLPVRAVCGSGMFMVLQSSGRAARTLSHRTLLRCVPPSTQRLRVGGRYDLTTASRAPDALCAGRRAVALSCVRLLSALLSVWETTPHPHSIHCHTRRGLSLSLCRGSRSPHVV